MPYCLLACWKKNHAEREKIGVKIIRKHIALIGLGLAFSVMIGMAFVTANMGDVVEVDVWIWPPRLAIEDDYYQGRGIGEWVVAFIKLPKDYSPNDVDLPSITLQVNGGSVPVSRYYPIWGRIIVAKFDRAEVTSLLKLLGHMTPHPAQRVTLVVMGNLHDGNVFRGEDTITVFFVDN